MGVFGFSLCVATGLWSASVVIIWFFHSPTFGFILLAVSATGFLLGRAILKCGDHVSVKRIKSSSILL